MTATMKIIQPVTITDGRLIASNVPEVDHPVWTNGASFTVGQFCIVPATHRIYRAEVENTNKYPPDNLYDAGANPPTGYWIDVSATNRWKMFDGKSRAATSRADSIEVTIAPGALCNSIALLGLVAASVSVKVTDPVEGEVYANTIDLYDYSGITGYYDWAFAPIVRKPVAVLLDLPAYPAASISIVVSDPAGIAQVGECILGKQKTLGTLQYGYAVGITDYSKKTRDDDGNAVLVERSYSEPINYTLRVESPKVYDIKRTLGGYRATPLVFIGSETALESIVYGWISDYRVTVDGARASTLTIDIEELN